MSIFSKNQPSRAIGGFSLIELMVTVTIVTMVTGLALVRYSSFNSTVLLNSQAYEVALDVRQTQLYSLSAGSVSQSVNSNVDARFRQPYGLEFRRDNPIQYSIFQDIDEDDQGDANEVFERMFLGTDFSIGELCVNGSTCSENEGAFVEVIFKRPDFNAKFRTNIGGSSLTITSVSIRLVDDQNNLTRDIVIDESGYVTVE